jgi:hypothetical protein
MCSRCGRGGMPIFRFGEERLCRTCYRKEPGTHRQCSQCGRLRPIENRGSNGEPVCPTCAQRPLHTCIDCGRQRPAQAVTPQGPVCAACYPKHQRPRRCGRCGNLAPITARATSDSPDICHSCWESDYGKRRQGVATPHTAATCPRPPGTTAEITPLRHLQRVRSSATDHRLLADRPRMRILLPEGQGSPQCLPRVLPIAGPRRER